MFIKLKVRKGETLFFLLNFNSGLFNSARRYVSTFHDFRSSSWLSQPFLFPRPIDTAYSQDFLHKLDPKSNLVTQCTHSSFLTLTVNFSLRSASRTLFLQNQRHAHVSNLTSNLMRISTRMESEKKISKSNFIAALRSARGEAQVFRSTFFSSHN